MDKATLLQLTAAVLAGPYSFLPAEDIVAKAVEVADAVDAKLNAPATTEDNAHQ